MTTIYLGLGSNIEPRRYLPLGITELTGLLGPLRCSPVYEGAAIGFDGAAFWNLVAEASTDLAVGDLQSALRGIEYRHGRPADANRFTPRTLDIDILTHGDQVGVIDGVELPRPEITTNAFVLRPLAELAGNIRHPALQVTYGQLWREYDQASQPLTPVSLPGDQQRSVD